MQALVWATRAAEQGLARAVKAEAALKARMTPSEIAAAEEQHLSTIVPAAGNN